MPKKRVSRIKTQQHKRLIASLISLGIAAIIFAAFLNQATKYTGISSRNTTLHAVPTLTPTPTIPAQSSYHIPILLYHYVEYVRDPRDTIRVSLDILPVTLEAQIKTLQDAGYTFLTMADVADILNQKESMPSLPVVLTFDDGYRDFYTDVYPVLKKYHVKAVSYVVPGFEDFPNYMYQWQVKTIAKEGLVEIAAHTMHHVYLKNMFLGKAKQEIDESKTELEREIGKPVVSFAYPYGAYDLQAETLVSDAGFETAVTTWPGNQVTKENRFIIDRIRPGARTGKELLHFLQNTQYSLR